MTDWYPPDTTPEVRTATPRKCRHEWERGVHMAEAFGVDGRTYACAICGELRDSAASRRGRTNRARGNAIERDWCHRLGLRLTGKYGDAADGDNAMFLGQCKSMATGRFPGWMADELAKLANLRTGRTPILGIVEAPGAGKRARRLVVLEEGDWIDLHTGVQGKKP